MPDAEPKAGPSTALNQQNSSQQKVVRNGAGQSTDVEPRTSSLLAAVGSDWTEPIARPSPNRGHSAMEKRFEHEGGEALSREEFAQRYSGAEAGEKWRAGPRAYYWPAEVSGHWRTEPWRDVQPCTSSYCQPGQILQQDQPSMPCGHTPAAYDDETSDGKPWAVIDNGTGHLRAGFSGEDAPKVSFSTCVGYPKNRDFHRTLAGSKDHYVGEEAQQKRGILILKYPINHGIVENWDDMEKIWKHTFDNELRIMVGDEEEADEDVAGVLMTEAPMNPKENRERMTQSMFETFNARRFYVTMQAVLSVYASGRTTGVSVDCGDGVSHTVPVYEGYAMPHAIGRSNLAGRDLDDYLTKILTESKINFYCGGERNSPNKIKSDLCYVSLDFANEVGEGRAGGRTWEGKERTFYMPDMSVVSVHNQMIRCPELLFQPGLNGKGMPGIHELTRKTVLDCDDDIRKDLYQNIVLSGGSTLFRNFGERMELELNERSTQHLEWPCHLLCRMQHFGMAVHPRLGSASPARALDRRMMQMIANRVGTCHGACKRLAWDFNDPLAKVIAPAERQISAWIGGSILASLSNFLQMTISSISHPQCNPAIVGYEEVGPRIVHMMCGQ